MYACLKESEQDFLPKAPGEHGIVVAKSLPEGLVYHSHIHTLILA